MKKRLLALLLAGIVVIGGYFVFEGIFVSGSFAAAAANIPFNALQAVLGACIGYVLLNVAERIYKN